MSLQPDGRPPFRADHIGSLLRPSNLRHAFREHADGKIAEAQFREIQDAAICDVVKLQEESGLQVVTDGEFRRTSYWARFVELTRGLAVSPQCAFASTIGGNPVSEADERAKLRRCVEAARAIWG